MVLEPSYSAWRERSSGARPGSRMGGYGESLVYGNLWQEANGRGNRYPAPFQQIVSYSKGTAPADFSRATFDSRTAGKEEDIPQYIRNAFSDTHVICQRDEVAPQGCADGSDAKKVHPLVASLRAMRHSTADNLVLAVNIARKRQSSQRATTEETPPESATRDTIIYGRRQTIGMDNTNGKMSRFGEKILNHSLVQSESTSPSPKNKIHIFLLGSDIEEVDTMFVYNCIVDGMAGHLLVDTRCEEVYKEGHIRRSIPVNAALHYQGKHMILISETGEMMTREINAVNMLEKAEGALSIKSMRGGYNEFQEMYSFMCEDSCFDLQEEKERTRLGNRLWFPSQVLSNIFIGGKETAEDARVCQNLRITHILSILAEPRSVRIPPGIIQKAIALLDEEDEDITGCFPEAYSFINDCVHSGGKVLVHCKMGKSRSATIVLMYIMRRYQQPLQATLAQVKKCRRQVHINKGFMRQLLVFEQGLLL